MIRRRSALLLILPLLLGGAIYSRYFTPTARGARDASSDIAREVYSVKIYGDGLGGPGSDYTAPIVAYYRDKHGIELEVVAGCVVSEDVMDYAEAYNAISVPAIKQAFGRDVFAAYDDLQRLNRLDQSLAALDEVDVAERRAAAESIAVNLKPGTASPDLLARLRGALESEDAVVQRWSLIALERIGENAASAAPSIRALLDSNDADVRRAAEEALRQIVRR